MVGRGGGRAIVVGRTNDAVDARETGGGRTSSRTPSARTTPTAACRVMDVATLFSATSIKTGIIHVSKAFTHDGRVKATRRE